MTERRSSEEQIRRLAYYDSLTGLPNRALFLRKLEGLLRYAHGASRMLGLLFIDVDRFKFVNDTLGHSIGDELLRAVAERLVDSLRLGDELARASDEAGDAGSVCRMGGDEFIVTILVRDRVEDVSRVAARLVAALSRPFTIQGREVAVSASVGVSIFPLDAKDAESLMRHADVAMYQAKSSGRDRFEIYTQSVDESVTRSLGLRSELRTALDARQFLLHYQPLVASSGRVVAFEALIRWEHPIHAMLSPALFIPLAEESGVITALGEWALETACRECVGWQGAGHGPIAVAVNLSAHQIRVREFGTVVERVLAQSGLPAECLELELTESILLVDTERAIETLVALCERGVRLSLDDFGTGYSSLSYLKRLPMHSLKIDRSFVRDLATDADDSAIVAAIVDVARRLELRVIAEGVEGAEQERLLRALGCEVMQGYPLRPADARRARAPLPRRLEAPRLTGLVSRHTVACDSRHIPGQGATPRIKPRRDPEPRT